MRLEITQKDINEGNPNHVGSCPIALALMRCCPGRYWIVNPHQAYSDTLRFILPEDAYLFIREFDSDRPVEPATFELTEVPRAT